MSMGCAKRPTRAVTQAMSIAETLMQLRIFYEDSRRDGPLAAGGLGPHLENLYTKRRSFELRHVLSVADCLKAAGLVLANDSIHDVLRVLDAIAKLVETGRYPFSELFMEQGHGNAPRQFVPDGLRFMRFKKHIVPGDSALASFAKLLVPHAQGMNPERILGTLRELERDHSMSEYAHHPMDLTLGVMDGITWSALDVLDLRSSDVSLYDRLMSPANFERRGEAWCEARKAPGTAFAVGLDYLPYQQPSRTTERKIKTPIVGFDSLRTEVRIATAAFVDYLRGDLGHQSGILPQMCERLCDSTTTSRFVGFTPSGMSALDPAAPQLMEIKYLVHKPTVHATDLNPLYVSSSMHDWLAHGNELPGICRNVTMEVSHARTRPLPL